ncbi:MAG TPA: glutaredoxin [Gaiellaceae bacterium]|nr:glutaredoxin [Gaiellaceae bacterium]
MIELYQAEWCPHSHAVRARLTELGVDYVTRQVPPDQEDRAALREATGDSSVPALVTAEGHAISGEEEILRWLDETYEEQPELVRRHRAKARTEHWLKDDPVTQG